MNRNSVSHFSLAPQVRIERSTFDRSCSVKTSFNCGSCVPFYWDEVLPGDSFKVKTSKVVRMQTLKTPMLDDVLLDTYYFFVPDRLLWNHFREFMGENTESEWIPETVYTIPQMEAPSGGWNVGTIADHLGVPPLVDNISVNALPFRAYALVMNEWFRSTAVQDPLVINLTDAATVGSNGSNYVIDTAKGGELFTANRFFDYFSAALPSPQFGESVKVSLAASSTLPVFTVPGPNQKFANLTGDAYVNAIGKSYPIQFDGPPYWTSGDTVLPLGRIAPYASSFYDGNSNYEQTQLARNQRSIIEGRGTNVITQSAQSLQDQNIDTLLNKFEITSVAPINLVASAEQAYTTINELREAFQIQRWMEKTARGGNRYIELLKAHFGVTSPDARLQRPEYLGGNRLHVNIRQITQTSSTTESSPMGDVAGMSVTTDSHFDFDKSFVEHGILLGICVARYRHTYQQGIPREFLRKTRFDYYWPSLAHLGESPIYNSQIYATGTDSDDEVFGYQEAWAEYRYKPNSVHGMMRSVANTGLDSWHLADNYVSQPYLSADWLKEDKTNLDRVLTVTSSVSDQFFADIFVDCKATRPMPLYSVPGLIDHF